jgi:hypothetical protein
MQPRIHLEMSIEGLPEFTSSASLASASLWATPELRGRILGYSPREDVTRWMTLSKGTWFDAIRILYRNISFGEYKKMCAALPPPVCPFILNRAKVETDV